MTEKALSAAETPQWLQRAGVTRTAIEMPLVGEVVDLTQPEQVARAWDELDGYIASLVTFRKAMAQVMLAYMDSQARHTMKFGDVKLTGDRSPTTDEYDTTILVELLDCDPPLPQERYDELVKQKPVEYTVMKSVARAVADSHPAWKDIIDRARAPKDRARTIRRAS